MKTAVSIPKADRRQRTPEQKRQTKVARLSRADDQRRRRQWFVAAVAAETAGHPLSITLHITWGALKHDNGAMGSKAFLGLPEIERQKKLWTSMRQVVIRHGVPWLAGTAPEHDAHRKLHLHMVMHLPDSAIHDAVACLERLTGVRTEWTEPRGRTFHGPGRQVYGAVAKSACGGWLLQRNLRVGVSGSEGIAAYASKASGKALVEGQYRLSNALSALEKSHRAA